MSTVYGQIIDCERCAGLGETACGACSKCHGSGFRRVTSDEDFGDMVEMDDDGPCPNDHGRDEP